MNRRIVNKKSIITSIISLLIFGLIFMISYYVTYSSFPDAKIIQSYFIIVGIIGSVPVLFQLYRLGLIFLAGASTGWILDCVITANMDPLAPTMKAGMYNLFVVIIGALLAIIVEVIYQLYYKKKA